MNRQEWLNAGLQTNEYKKIVKEAFKKWKMQYHPNERCDIHHRDDTEEACNYNEKYYERWGCEEDGAFIEGKYVIFMTCSEHSRHHNTGDRNPTKRPEVRKKLSIAQKGKKLSEETCRKMSEAHKGKKRKPFSEEIRHKLSEAHKGKKFSEKTRQKMSEAHKGEKSYWYGKTHTEETKSKMSEASKTYMKTVSDLWKLYKQLQPDSTMTYHEFRHSLKTNKEV